MGMAASQARYLALTARKTNTEYEGQQINQARTALANQSANLFNRLLDLEVPVAPKTTDYTEVQYSYSDGTTEAVLEEWTQLSSPNPDSNYLVKQYYYVNRFTGAMKQLNDPQVQISNGTVTTTNAGVTLALNDLNTKENTYNTAVANRQQLETEAQNLANYETVNNITSATKISNDEFDVVINGTTVKFKSYGDCSRGLKPLIDNAYTALTTQGAIDSSFNKNDMFVSASGKIAFRSDLEKLYGINTGQDASLELPTYENAETVANSYSTKISAAYLTERTALGDYTTAKNYYNDLIIPTHIGNCELTPVDANNKEQITALKQIVADMNEQNINADINNCFDASGNYLGGIYTFQMNGNTYYATYEELMTSYDSQNSVNDIDGQNKLPYYNATYIKTRIEETEEALLETDSNGRFKSVKFKNNSAVYSLNTETVTDDEAYQDAMNEYNYKVQLYEKTIADINARTSIIQQEDRTLELRLKQLDTEQNALSTELEAVKKVIKDNVEKTFKTFSD